MASAGGVVEQHLVDDAQEIILESQKASASFLQRRMRIGYARAARILDILEERGIIGPADGAKPRDVYVKDKEDVDIVTDPNNEEGEDVEADVIADDAPEEENKI